MSALRMTRGQKISLGVFVAVLLFFAGAVTAITASLYYSGDLAIDVRATGPRGDAVSVRVPGGLVKAALAALPDRVFAEPAAVVRPHLPIVKAALKALSNSPDAVLVEVESPDESVRVAKSGRVLSIRVETADETVRLHVPMRLLGAIVGRLEHVSGKVHAHHRGDST